MKVTAGGRLAPTRALASTPFQPPPRAWMLPFVFFLAVVWAWALATPLFASPDEPDHVDRAAAVVRGELAGHSSGSAGVRPKVTAPRGVISASKHDLCFAFHPQRTADCATPLRGGAELVRVRSGAGRYNPAYYLAVGWPSLAFPDAVGVYLMRLVSGVLCAGFLASAFASAAQWARSRLLLLGLLVAVSPMVVFLAGTVNPNAVEIAAAVSLWTSGLVLARTAGHTPQTATLIRRCALAAAALVVTRSLSPLWLALIGLGLLLVAGRARVRALGRRRDSRIWAGAVGVLTVLSVAWTLRAGALGEGYPSAQPVTALEALRTSVLRMPWRMLQMVGVFGWLDTRAPWLTYIGWAAMVGVALAVGLAGSTRRGRLLVLAALGLTVVVPVLIEASNASTYGFIWQGRYTLPLAVGVPLVAAVAAGERGLLRDQLTRSLVTCVAVVAGLAHAGAFWWALLRYQVGAGRGYNPLVGQWHPPIGSLGALVLFGLGLTGYLLLARREAVGQPGPPAAARA